MFWQPLLITHIPKNGIAALKCMVIKRNGTEISETDENLELRKYGGKYYRGMI